MKKPKTVPKYALKLLERRRRLAQELMCACYAVDEYCKKIGVDFNDPNACSMTDIRIYCEVDGAYGDTLAAIKKALDIENENQ